MTVELARAMLPSKNIFTHYPSGGCVGAMVDCCRRFDDFGSDRSCVLQKDSAGREVARERYGSGRLCDRKRCPVRALFYCVYTFIADFFSSRGRRRRGPDSIPARDSPDSYLPTHIPYALTQYDTVLYISVRKRTNNYQVRYHTVYYIKSCTSAAVN